MKKQRVITAGVTLAAVAVTANLMQRGGTETEEVSAAQVAGVSAARAAPVAEAEPNPPQDAPQTPEQNVQMAAATAEPKPAPVMQASVSDALPRPPRDMLMPKPLPQVGTDLKNRMIRSAPAAAKPATGEEQRNEFGLACGPILSATPGEAAMVTLTLTAPCRSDQRITVRNNQLAFSGRVDRLGFFTAEVPALEAQASFTVTFPDGSTVATEADVPAALEVERVALTFQGNAGLQIHALEFGAGYGDEGHIWAGRPRGPVPAVKAGGGFMVSLGDPLLDNPQLAEIYTFPQDAADRGGAVRLSVEAEVTAYNCDTEVAGQTMERGADGAMSVVSITVAIPDCSAVGEYLVLKNLLRDMKIASN